MKTLWHDLWCGPHHLAKHPGFTAVAVLLLAIGIGANSAIFSVTNVLLLRRLPYKNAERLVILNGEIISTEVVTSHYSCGNAAATAGGCNSNSFGGSAPSKCCTK